MFLVSLNYIKPLDEVDKHLEGHVKFLEEQYGDKIFIFSGRKKPRTGGVILVNLSNREELDRILKNDPFYKHSIAEYEVIDFEISKCDELFKPFIQ